MAKPMQVARVSAVPLISPVADAATSFDSCGESAVTAKPHIHQADKNSRGGSMKKTGEIRQHMPDIARDVKATLRLPIFSDIKPPKAHDSPPSAITIPVHRGTEKSIAVFVL